MFSSVKRQWQSLTNGSPGRRFQDRYAHNQRTKASRSLVGRIVRLGLALVAFAIGVILVFIPGPAILFFALAGALVAAESRFVARSLDWTEVKLRAIISWGKRHWKKLHAPGKAAVLCVATLCTAAAAYASYRMFMG